MLTRLRRKTSSRRSWRVCRKPRWSFVCCLSAGRYRLYLRLPTEQEGFEWVQVGPLNAFEAMPLSLSILLAVIILLGLAGAIYVIVRGVEARMARLELAATRIASGHLIRAKVESGDFMGV
ncbi:hypothetical protein DSL92_03370 [Billgrantia gudaonensis]|uniref:Uncharacterized protein n=1 Tax=Billgrantia gudaonensis TaxID=376427 RepID=A0A3S0NHK3_9GAMM|nr:hypothetical protein DSL92_03370 [Halomonas gudaonensis]